MAFNRAYSVDAAEGPTPLKAAQSKPITGAVRDASLYPGGSPGNYVSLTPYGCEDFDPGQTVRFALVIAQFAGTGNVTAGCNLFAQIANRNPSSSPF